MKVFISYTSTDRAWAHWIGWNLHKAGHEPFVHEWEIGAGENIPRWMEDRLGQSQRLIGLFSDAYCEALYSQSERWAAYWQDPGGRTGFLIPIEVSKVTKWPVFIEPLKRLSLVGLNEVDALSCLLAFLERPKLPAEKPDFPGDIQIILSRSEEHISLDSPAPSFPTARGVGGGHLNFASDSSAFEDQSFAIRCIDDFESKPIIFGRDDEIEIIVRGFLEARTILIAGGPGMGKTAVATAAIRDSRVEARFGRRRVFASLETASEPRAILARLVETLGVPPIGDEASLLRIIETSAADRPIAAIIDNAETAFEADRSEAERIVNLIAHITGLSLAITIRGVAPPIPGTMQIDDLPKLPAIAARDAFLSIAGSSFKSDSDLTHLLEALDGHALSIRLVAAQAIGLPSLQGLRESWDEAHAEILRISGEEEGRLTSVRASLALSLNSRRMRSTPLARRLMTLLSFLPGGLAENDVHVLLGERGTLTKAKANEAVVCLHQLRLVERRLDRRLRMLTPLRECVKYNLTIMDTDQKRLTDLYLGLATKAGEIGGKRWQLVREVVELEADNLDPICALAVEVNITHRRLPQAFYGLTEFHIFAGRGSVNSIQSAVVRLQQTAPSLFLAECVRLIGRICIYRGDDSSAKKNFNEALVLYRRLRNEPGEAICLRNLGEIALRRYDLEASSRLFNEALTLNRRIGIILGEANCIKYLGKLALYHFEFKTARTKFNEALTLYKSIGDVMGEATCIFELGGIAFICSEQNKAQESFEEALALSRGVGDTLDEANGIVSLAGISFQRSEYEAAQRRCEEALALFRQIGNVPGEAVCIESLGDIAFAHADYQKARTHYDQALALYARSSTSSNDAGCVVQLARIELACSDYGKAIGLFEEALVFQRERFDCFGEAQTMVRLGRARCITGDEGRGFVDIEAGFALYFSRVDDSNLALPGWRAIHRALTSKDNTEAHEQLEAARSAWTRIGRLDLIRDWVDWKP